MLRQCVNARPDPNSSLLSDPLSLGEVDEAIVIDFFRRWRIAGG